MRFRSPWFSMRTFFLFLSFSGCAAVLFSTPTMCAQQAYAHNLPKRIVGDYGYWSKYQTPAYSVLVPKTRP